MNENNQTPSQTDFDLEFQEVTGDPVPTQITESELPDKYRGKSPEEIARMHMNAEKRLSQLGNELGTLRKQADQLLNLKKENVTVPETPRKPLTVDEIFSDPDKAIRDTIESSSVARRTEDAVNKVDNIERQLALREFESRHPSYKDDLVDDAFQDWVAGNPARRELFRRADAFDVASADALWQMWGEYKQLKDITEQRKQTQERRKAAISAGKTIPDSSAESPSKGPVYSRTKLMDLHMRANQGDQSARLKWNDKAFQDELLRAYSEGRVR